MFAKHTLIKIEIQHKDGNYVQQKFLFTKQIASFYNALIVSTYSPAMTRLFCKNI